MLFVALLSILAAESVLGELSFARDQKFWVTCDSSLLEHIPSGHLFSPLVKIACPDPSPPVKVYWNVIMENTFSGGDIPNSTIHRQIGVLNQDFAPVGLSFELAEIRRVNNPTWFRISWKNSNRQDSEERKMKRSLGVKDPSVLNIYSAMSVTPLREEPASWAYIPKDDAMTDPSLDGVVLNIRMIASQWTPGHTLTHEVGHWIGLRHTFDGGCDSVNDGIDDTPRHTQGSRRCNTPSRSRCDPQLLEPVNNFMNVVEDHCMKSFTPGQIERMRRNLRSYRGIVVPSKEIPS